MGASGVEAAGLDEDATADGPAAVARRGEGSASNLMGPARESRSSLLAERKDVAAASLVAIDLLSNGSFLAERSAALTWNDFRSSLSARAAIEATLGLTAERLSAERRGEVVLAVSERGCLREGVPDETDAPVFLDVSRRTSSRSSRSSISYVFSLTATVMLRIVRAIVSSEGAFIGWEPVFSCSIRFLRVAR